MSGERLPTLAVMAKRPVRGGVKTRLAAGVGDELALAVYADLLGRTLDQAELLEGVELVLAMPDPPTDVAAPDILAARSRRWRRLRQHGDGLGERLGAVLGELFAGGAPAVVAVNSDSPPIPLDYLRRGFASLAAGRLVVGPAADGGYYLIGCDRQTWTQYGEQLLRLLATSPMSSSRLLTHTLRGAHALGLEPVQLPLWVDVDGPDQLAVLARLAGDAPSRGEPLSGLREVYLHLTHRCARACRHCYNKAAAAGPELSTAEWKDVIDQCAALGASSFVFIGGDPLLRRDLVELVGHVTASPAASARFFFNSLIDERTARRLATAGRDRLTPLASLDGPRHVNDWLRGTGSFDDVMTSVANLLDAGLAPVANTVLVKPVLAGLPQLARELRQASIDRLHLILPHQQGMEDQRDLLPSGDELLAAVRELLVTAADVDLTVDNLPSWRRRIGRRNDLCAAGCRDLAVDPSGEVHACAITVGDPAFAAGALRERDLATIWRESPSLRLLRASRARDRDACRACPVVDACGGECWVQAHYAARARGEPAGYAARFPYCGLVRPLLSEMLAGAPSLPAAGVQALAGGGQAAAGAEAHSLFDCI